MAVTSQDIQKLYIAYFNRPADYFGLQFQVTAANATSLAAVANGFAASAEFLDTYAGKTDAQFVNQLYINLFGRESDLPGLSFWLNLLNTKVVTKGTIALELLKGAINQDATTIANKVAAAEAFYAAIDTTPEATYYSGTQANAVAKLWLAGITTDASLAAAIVPAALDATLASVVAAGTPTPPVTTTALTVGLDTVLAGAGNDIINGGLIESLSAFDSIDGGAGTDTLNVLTALTGVAGGVTVKNVENVNINTSGAGYTIDASSYTNLAKLSIADSAQVAGNIVVDAASAVSIAATGTTTGAITVGATTAATGAVTISETSTLAGNVTAGAITVKGGTTVSITESASNSGAVGTTGVQSAVNVTGTAATTSVTVVESAAVTTVAAVTESAVVTWQAMAMVAGTQTIGGMTITSDGAATHTAAEVATVAGGGAVAGLSITTAPTLWTVAAAAGATNVFTSTTASSNVADITAGSFTGAGNVAPTAVTTQGNAGVAGLAVGNVTITDVNAASTTAAGAIASVNLTNFAAATVNSGALTSVTLGGKGATFTQTSGALTTAVATTEALNLNSVTMSGAVTLGAVPKTVNIASAGGTNKLSGGLSATGATTVNISGDKALTVTGHTFDAAAKIVSTSTGAVTFTGAILAGQTYTGGAGVDTITLSAAGTTAITTGAGDDFITYAGALGTGGSVDGGLGSDTLSMTAAQAVTATGSATFAGTVSGFDVLSLSAATGAATAINMANADGINNLSIAGSTVGALDITGALANFTLTERAASTAAVNVSLASDVGTADNVNLAFSAADGFTNTGMTTVANVESIKITTTDADTTAQTAVIVTPITAAAATTVTVSGNMGVSLIGGMTQTVLTSLDASGLTASGANGGLTWTAGALAAAATVKGGAAGTNVIDFSAATKAVTYTGGSGADTLNFASVNTQNNVITLGNGANAVNAATATGNNTITGGTGVDLITVGSGSNTIVAGDGNDVITIGAAAGLNTVNVGAGTDTVVFAGIQTAAGYYTSITGMAAGDSINFAAIGTVAAEATLGAKITLGGVASFANYLDAAVAGNATGAVNWFQFNGNTYVTVDNDATGTFKDGADVVVELVGLVDLSTSVVAAEILTLA